MTEPSEPRKTPIADLVQSAIDAMQRPEARLIIEGQYWSQVVGGEVLIALVNRLAAAQAVPDVRIRNVIETLRAERDDVEFPADPERKAGWHAAIDALERELERSTATVSDGRDAALEEAATCALELRWERGTPWNRACTAIATAIRVLKSAPTNETPRPSLTPKGEDINIESPKQAGDRPDGGPFTREHFARLKQEWDAMRVLPDDSSWNMDKFQWNGVSDALEIAASRAGEGPVPANGKE